MSALSLHPAELAYAFAYARVEEVIGWGSAPFLPGDGDGDPALWLDQGERRLLAQGRLLGRVDEGLSFTDAMSEAVLALAAPALVLLAERAAPGGLRRMTVHAAGDVFAGLTRGPDGGFELTRYAEITAAAGACAGFLGASLDPVGTESRIEADGLAVSGALAAARAGRETEAVAALVAHGAAPEAARDALGAVLRPRAAGVLSVLYLSGGAVEAVEAITVATDAHGRSWAVLAPAGEEGPTILERSSAAALTARVAVDVAARLTPSRADGL